MERENEELMGGDGGFGGPAIPLLLVGNGRRWCAGWVEEKGGEGPLHYPSSHSISFIPLPLFCFPFYSVLFF